MPDTETSRPVDSPADRRQENRRLFERIFAGLAVGDGTAFLESLADDFCWTVTGTTSWSGTYEGKAAVRSQLLGPLFALFADRYTNTAHRILADGEYVVVECRGRVTTKAGKRYDNTYCWVCRVTDGKLRELTEYLDTALVETALGPRPPARVGGEAPSRGGERNA